MKHLISALVVLIMTASSAFAEDRKPVVVVGSTMVEIPAGDTLKVNPSSASSASINIPQGTAPTSPVDGDMWTTSAGIYVQSGGKTVGPLSPGIPVNPVWFGCDPTGVSDCTAAVTSAYAVSKYIKFPPGKFRFNSAKTFTISGPLGSAKIEGSGADLSTFYFPATSGWTFQLSSQGQSIHLADFSITTGGQNQGNAITIQNSSTFIGTFVAQSDISRVTCRGEDGYGVNMYWSTCFSVISTTDITLDGVNAYGDSTALHGTGIAFSAPSGGLSSNCLSSPAVCGTTYLISKSNFSFLGVGISLGTNTQSVSVDTSFIAQVENGIVIQNSARTLQGLNVTSLHCFAYRRCLIGLSSQPNLQIIGGYMNVANGYYAIDIPSSQGTITGVTFFPRDSANPSNSGAIAVRASTNTCGISGISSCAGPMTIDANSYTSVTTATLIDTGASMVRIGASNAYNNLTNSVIDNGAGNFVGALVQTAAGRIGYASGAGGTVIQATSKATAVNLNKPAGVITTSNAALAANIEIGFTFNNTSIRPGDLLYVQVGNGNYGIRATDCMAGSCVLRLKNLTSGSLSDAVAISYVVIGGATN